MLKQWNVDEVARKMPSRLLSEWIAFMKFEDIEIKKADLEREVKHEAEFMRVRRRKNNARK
jgi:hypothetical protein